MKNIQKKLLFLLIFITATSVFLNSCQNFKDFDINQFTESEFYEINNVSDSMWVNGSFAAPILDTRLTLGTLIPKTDSSLWAEVDNDDLVHLRSYFKNLLVATGSQIFSDLPATEGTVINSGIFSFQTDTSKLKVYEQALSGHLFFNNPKVTFKFTNQIPIVTFFKLDTLTFHYIAGVPDSVTHTSNTNYVIQAPTVFGGSSKTNVVIDKTVIPELPQIFSPIPKFISFYVTVGSTSAQALPFDVNGNETISMDVDIDLPLDARLWDFTMGDTIPFDLSGDTYKEVTSIELRLELDNGFPFDALSQLTFTDSLNVFEENLFEGSGWLLDNAEINNTGIVTSSKISRVAIIITQEQLQRLRDNKVTRLVYKSNLNTVDSNDPTSFIKIFSYYQLGVKIGVKADYGFNLLDSTLFNN